MNQIKIISILMLLIFFSQQSIFACRCYTPQPPCYAYSQSEAVFIATVKEIQSSENAFLPYLQKIRMTVDKSYKGVNSEEVFTKIGGTSCDFEGFEVNEKFLIYGGLYDDDKTFFSTGYCSRSQSYREDSIDFEFLNSLSNSTPNYWIWGTVSRGYRGSGIEGVKVEVLDNKKKLNSISDKNGNLKISVSKEGIYKVRVYEIKGAELGVSDWEEQRKLPRSYGRTKQGHYIEYEVEVKNNRCGWFDTILYGLKQ